jgi:hypothetical protein
MEQRRESLRATYGFLCNCPRCAEDKGDDAPDAQQDAHLPPLRTHTHLHHTELSDKGHSEEVTTVDERIPCTTISPNSNADIATATEKATPHSIMGEIKRLMVAYSFSGRYSGTGVLKAQEQQEPLPVSIRHILQRHISGQLHGSVHDGLPSRDVDTLLTELTVDKV